MSELRQAPGRESDQSLEPDQWCHTFAAIYRHQCGCTRSDALSIASKVRNSLGELSPSDAVLTIMLNPQFVEAMSRVSRARCHD
jgi:hypothetical protein